MTDKKKENGDTVFKKHEKDTGSSAVQIVDLSNDIKSLTVHMQVNKKDFACRRTLLQKVAKRRTLLKYLKRTDEQMYVKVMDTLGLKR
jgi:small subunit ribosomal protein S15